MKTFTYRIAGTAVSKNPWVAEGDLVVPTSATFMEVLDLAMSTAFMDLTEGRAVFGQPGLGCNGPYHIDSLNVEKKP